MVWWTLGLAGAFYLLFRGTAPKPSDVFKKGGGNQDTTSATDGEIDVPVDQSGNRRPGVKEQTLEGFVGKDQAQAIEKKYDPAKNPFRRPEKPDDFKGSYDDMTDAEMPDVEIETDQEIDDGYDVDTESESNGQI